LKLTKFELIALGILWCMSSPNCDIITNDFWYQLSETLCMEFLQLLSIRNSCGNCSINLGSDKLTRPSNWKTVFGVIKK